MESLFNIKIEKKPHLRRVVYEHLKDAILTGAIPKGTRLIESKIAEGLGISRTPVREALHALERDMLIIAIDKVGYEIIDTDIEDLEEISELRKTVEVLALKKAISNLTDMDVATLERNLERSEEALREHRGEDFIELDAEFHKTICSLSKRERLIRMAEGLRKEMQRFRSKTKLHGELSKESLKFHRMIVESLKEKNYRKAKKLLKDHIEHAKRYTKMVFLDGKVGQEVTIHGKT
ncbi:MAG: GntR family transcriptional regulator [Syntrophorhabdaceae bacterium]|nr:GntR family transcriptional regulator [Syntrophorhabdaceae bacterium]